MNKIRTSRGFIAVTAVILLAAGVIAFSLAALGSAVLYSDAVNRRELRIQAGMNAEACLDSAALMAAKDYFLIGSVYISEFGCNATISRNSAGDVSVKASARLVGVSSD
jgi:type II secretory pathway pseudopilin PulG